MPERDLLVTLLSKDQYHNYNQAVDRKHLADNYRELSYVYKALDELHKVNPDDLTLDELKAFFFHSYPDSDHDLYVSLFDTLSNAKVGVATGSAMLKQMKERKEALKLSEAAYKFSTGNADMSAIQIAYDEMSGVEQATDDDFNFVSDDLEVILNDTVASQGMRWRLDFLNKSLGSLRKGDFGFLFARPETGKTTFLASEIGFMLRNLKEDAGPVIWFNFEEQGSKVMLRLYQAYFGVRLDQLLSNPRKYRDEFNKQVQGRFKLVDDANMHKTQVEKLLKSSHPSLIVCDPLDKVKGFAADREDLRLGGIYIWARELAKTYAPFIAVCQADGTAEGQKWLTMDNVANAKTSKQAEADWILGVGKTHAEGSEFVRYLNISKNKLSGDSDSIPSMRHGRGEVLIKPEVARYQDIIKYS